MDGISIDISEVIGGGYKEFWNFKKRYRVCKGGRGSKKSCTAALWYIYNIMKYYHQYNVKPNVLVVRRYFNTHKDSTRAQLIWAINKLKVAHLWNIPRSELTLTYKPSGQQILFRGLDDAQSLTSLTVAEGELCWVWWEEAFQVTNEDDFNKVDLSIRGDMPEPLFKQHTLTFNPWSEKIWIKKRFFDIKDPDTLALTTTYLQNEFLGEDDIEIFNKMKEMNARRYDIEGLGNWGISEGLIFTNWEEKEFEINSLIEDMTYRGLYGLDFGYNDPTAFTAMRQRRGDFIIYLYDEFYRSTMNNKTIANTLIDKGYGSCKIKYDNEDPRTGNELKLLGLTGMTPAKKGPGSVLGGIQKLQDYRMIVHPRCYNTVISLSNYCWRIDPKTGIIMNEPAHDYSHIPDAIRYGTEDLNRFGIKFA